MIRKLVLKYDTFPFPTSFVSRPQVENEASVYVRNQALQTDCSINQYSPFFVIKLPLGKALQRQVQWETQLLSQETEQSKACMATVGPAAHCWQNETLLCCWQTKLWGLGRRSAAWIVRCACPDHSETKHDVTESQSKAKSMLLLMPMGLGRATLQGEAEVKKRTCSLGAFPKLCTYDLIVHMICSICNHP